MRFLLKVTMPTEAGNRAVRDPNFGQTMQEILTEIKAESSYWTADGGQRTGYIIVQVQEPHELPNIAEPFFQGLGANVEFLPAMTFEDLAKAGPAIEKWSKRFG